MSDSLPLYANYTRFHYVYFWVLNIFTIFYCILQFILSYLLENIFCAKTNAEKYEIREFISRKGHGKSEHIKQVDERCGEKCYITIDCLWSVVFSRWKVCLFCGKAQSVFSGSCFHAALGNQTGTEYISIVNVISY